MNKFIQIIKILLTFFFLFFSNNLKAEEKIKIGLLVPLSGENKEIGQQIIKAVRLAIKDIDSDFIEIIPRDTASTASRPGRRRSRLGCAERHRRVRLPEPALLHVLPRHQLLT